MSTGCEAAIDNLVPKTFPIAGLFPLCGTLLSIFIPSIQYAERSLEVKEKIWAILWALCNRYSKFYPLLLR
jgi:hypothetical protein